MCLVGVAKGNSDKEQILRRHALAPLPRIVSLRICFLSELVFWQFKLNNEMFCYCLKFEHIVLANAVNCATIVEFLIRIARYSTAQRKLKINP